MKKQLHNYRSLTTFGALLALTNIINLAAAQTPVPTRTLPERPIVAMEVEEHGPIKATPVLAPVFQAIQPTPAQAVPVPPIGQAAPVPADAVPAQVLQTVNQAQAQAEDDQHDENVSQTMVDNAWLNYIFSAALLPPLADHSNIATAPNKPTSGSVTTSLMHFTYKTFDELLNTGIDIDSLDADNEIPHARKLLVNPEDEIYFGGDIHGSIGALTRLIWLWRNMGVLDKNFKVAPGKYLVFLGDYVDYGKEGISVLYALINLKLLNWDNIILLRGNHESAQMSKNHGFNNELLLKYGPRESNQLLVDLNNFFGLLPNVLYIGLDNQHSFIQCCHGGIEPGFNPKAFLESNATFFDLTNTFENYQFDDALMTIIEPDQTKRDDLKNSLLREMIDGDQLVPTRNGYGYASSVDSGFQWSDMIKQATFDLNKSRGLGFVASKELMSKIGKACKICAYIRGHQHNHGVKIGDMERANVEDARWYKFFGLQPQPASVEFKFSVPLVLSMDTVHAYPALVKIAQLQEQQPLSRQEYTAAWQEFKNTLPHFAFSTFVDCLPIITLTSASEAAAENRVNNPWDSFGLCTIKGAIEDSYFAIYEAEASAPQQSPRDQLMKWAEQQKQWSQGLKFQATQEDDENKDPTK